MTHTLWMLGTLGYELTLKICNTHCSFMAITVTQTRLNIASVSTRLHVDNVYMFWRCFLLTTTFDSEFI
jgi:hypothetical protein